MQRGHGLALIILGSQLILVPAVAHAIPADRDQERVAQLSARNPEAVGATLTLQPTEHSGYDWACFGVGAALAAMGVRRTASRCSTSAKPEGEWGSREV
jgi:hypothetical protein